MNIGHYAKAFGLSLFTSASLFATAAGAQSFAGRTIDMVVGFSPGGGHDTYARLLAQHMPRFLEGSPNIVIQNMPGAGAALAAEFVYRSTLTDGTLIGTLAPGPIVSPALTGDFAGRYDPQELIYLGTANLSTRVCVVWGQNNPQTYDELVERGIILGTTAPGGSTYDYAHLLRNLIGDQIRIISGYPGTTEITNAMETGEVDALCGVDWSTIKTNLSNQMADGTVTLLLQFVVDSEPELDELGIPSLTDLIPEEDREAVDLILTQQVFGRPYVLPPSTDPEVVEILRDAFMQTMESPEFLAQAETMRLDILPARGDELQEVIGQIYGASPETLERARELLATE